MVVIVSSVVASSYSAAACMDAIWPSRWTWVPPQGMCARASGSSQIQVRRSVSSGPSVSMRTGELVEISRRGCVGGIDDLSELVDETCGVEPAATQGFAEAVTVDAAPDVVVGVTQAARSRSW